MIANTSRGGLGRIATVVVVVVVVAIAGGVGFALSSRGGTTTSSSSTTSTSETPSSTSSTTSSTTLSTNSTTATSSNSTTSSTSVAPVGCVFSPPGPIVVSTTRAVTYTGCLTPGTSGVYLLAITDPNGVIVQGVVRAQYPSMFTIAGAPVDNLTAGGNGGVATSANDTTVLSMPDLLLFGDRGYSLTVVNQSQQNDTITIIFNMSDAAVFEG